MLNLDLNIGFLIQRSALRQLNMCTFWKLSEKMRKLFFKVDFQSDEGVGFYIYIYALCGLSELSYRFRRFSTGYDVGLTSFP